MITTAPTPAAGFALLIDGLCRAIAAQSAADRLAAPLLILVWSRLRRLAVRFAALAARIRAARLPATGAGRCRAAPRRPPAPRPVPPDRGPRLPGGFAWLVRLVPQAAASGSQLQRLLGDPEMAAIIAAAPQIGRMLRPLCRMLGVAPPPGLRAPRPVVAEAASVPATPGAAPSTAASPAGPPRPRRAARPAAPLPRLRARSPPIFG